MGKRCKVVYELYKKRGNPILKCKLVGGNIEGGAFGELWDNQKRFDAIIKMAKKERVSIVHVYINDDLEWIVELVGAYKFNVMAIVHQKEN